MNNTFSYVSVRVGFPFVLFPFGNHLSPPATEVCRKDCVELLVDGHIFVPHREGLAQVSKK